MTEEVQKLDTATRSHHPDSPSSLQASEACPLFTNEQRESQASLDGVLQHKAAETRDLTILDGNESWESAVKFCLAVEDEVIESLTVDGPTDGTTVPPEVVREKYLNVGDDLVVTPEKTWLGVTGGFPDTLVLNAIRTNGAIIDFKFGRQPVAPTKDNLQGKAYALAALQAYPTLQCVRVIFVAPHQGWDVEYQKNTYDHTFWRSDMPAMDLHIRTVIAQKRAAQEDLEKKGDWSAAKPHCDLCVFCALKGRCTKNLTLTLKASKYEALTVPEKFTTLEISTPDQVAHAYKAANQLEPILKAIRKHCVSLALTQDMLPADWKLVRRQDREISGLDHVIEAAKRHGVAKKEVLDALSISIGKIEELVKSKAPKGMGAAAVRGFSDTLESLGAVKMGPAVHFLQQVKTPAEKPKLEVVSQEPALDI